MAQIYTQEQANTITSFRYRLFVDGTEIGPLAVEDLAYNVTPNMEPIGSSMTGETPIAHINKGTAENTLSVTVQGFAKDQIKTAFSNIIAGGSTATTSSTPFTGTLRALSTPGRAKTVAVVAVLYYTDENGVDQSADATVTDLPCNILMPKAVVTDGADFVFNPTAVFQYTLTFTGNADVVNDGQVSVMDDGIDSDGTYTP